MGKKKTQQPAEGNKVTLSIRFPPELLERARTVVYYTPGETLGSLAERAILRELERMERSRGEPYPDKRGPLKTGRPIQRSE